MKRLARGLELKQRLKVSEKLLDHLLRDWHKLITCWNERSHPSLPVPKKFSRFQKSACPDQNSTITIFRFFLFSFFSREFNAVFPGIQLIKYEIIEDSRRYGCSVSPWGTARRTKKYIANLPAPLFIGLLSQCLSNLPTSEALRNTLTSPHRQNFEQLRTSLAFFNLRSQKNGDWYIYPRRLEHKNVNNAHRNVQKS